MAVNGTTIARRAICWGIASLALLLSLPLPALDPDKAINQYVHRVWNVESGLPQNSVRAILQTGDRYLWLATEEGLARFDGRRFTTFNKVNTEVMRDHHTLRLMEDSRGRLWIGCWDGLLLIRENGVFRNALSGGETVPSRIHAIFEDSRGTIWVGTVKGLLRHRDGVLEPHDFGPEREGLKIFSFDEDSEGTIWAGSNQGLLRLDADGFRFLTTVDGLPTDLVREVHVDRRDRVWLGTYGGGLARWTADGVATFTIEDGLPGPSINTILEDRNGNLWIGTSDSGICRYDGTAFTTYNTGDGLSNNYVEALFEDADGNLWVGTSGGGVDQFIDGRLTTIFGPESLTNDVVFSVLEDREGDIWAGTMAGLTRLRPDGRVEQFTTANGLADNLVLTLTSDGAGDLWIGTRRGIQRRSRGTFQGYTTEDGLADDLVTAVKQVADESIWIGTGAGINRYADGTLSLLSGDEAFIACRVIHPAGIDRTWVGTRTQGVLVLDLEGRRVAAHDVENGLATNHVLDIHQDERGVFWVASVGGITRIEGSTHFTITIRHGLYCDEVFRILEDREGRFWMTGNKGLFTVERSALDALAEGRTDRVKSRVFDKADGMMSTECNGVAQPAGWMTRAGRIYFPTIKGMVTFDPSSIAHSDEPPPVMVESVFIDDVAYAPQGTVLVPPGSHRLEIHYTALSFLAPHLDRFRYRMEGYDKQWINAGGNRMAVYTEIPPGRYRFRVTASPETDPPVGACASLALEFEPRFYETPLFIFSGILALTLLVLGGHRYRIRQHARREELLSDLVDRRTQKLKKEIAEHEVTQQALSEEQKRLSTTLESIGEGIITTDTEGRIILMNRVAERFTGWSTEEALGKPADEILQIIRERNRKPLGDITGRVLRDGQVLEPSTANLLIDRFGDERQIVNSAAPVRDNDGRIQGVVLVLIDTTEKRKMEQELLKMSKLESIGLLAGGIAHDFNNILTSILGNVTLLDNWLEPGGQVAESLRDTKLACRRAAELTQQLLTFAKGGAPIKQVLSIGKLLREHAGFAISGSNVSCDLAIAEGLLAAEADPSQLGQVIQNLVINGIQAMPDGGIISIRAENLVCEQNSGDTAALPLEPGRYVKISFRDHGRGIAPEILPNIFDPYFTTKGGGSGLGLAISYSIVRKHKGHLLAESVPGQGATFIVYLPATDRRPPTEPEPDQKPLPGTGRILIMDDEELIRLFVRKLLDSLGFTAVTVSDGLEAVRVYREAMEQGEPFDVVILDLTVPGGMGGVETLRRLREINSEVQAIVASGYSSDRVLANHEEYHFRGVLIKPFGATELAQCLSNITGPPANADG